VSPLGGRVGGWVATCLSDALRDRGAVALGAALRFNGGLAHNPAEGLSELNLRENSIGEKGSMVIADALKENRCLSLLTLDDNPVGPRGGRAIFRALEELVFLRRDCAVEIKGCNFSSAMHDSSADAYLSPNSVEKFDRDEPGGTWVCDVRVNGWPCMQPQLTATQFLFGGHCD
jgi:hypothetical protein